MPFGARTCVGPKNHILRGEKGPSVILARGPSRQFGATVAIYQIHFAYSFYSFNALRNDWLR